MCKKTETGEEGLPLGIILLEESRREGNSIEIPSIKITIPPHTDEEKRKYDEQVGARA